jgi:perosamine synthetase
MIRWAEPNITQEDIDYVKEVLDSGWFSMGNQVKLLEEKMKNITQRKYAFAVNNGTSALTVALRSLGIGIGDEVIVPALSYIATATAVNLVGAKPVFADVNKRMTLDPQEIDRAITIKTKAIISVDFGGNPCYHDLIKERADAYKISVLHDGAQSIGAMHKDKPCLSYGNISTTSFHAAKQITTVEGGMIFTDNKDVADKLIMIRGQGEGKTKYVHEILGGNYRMTDVLASLAIKQMDRIVAYLHNRYSIVVFYKQLLKDVVDYVDIDGQGNFMFVILSDKRDEIAEHLRKNNVETRAYRMTIPQQPIYNIKTSYPVAEDFAKRMLSLPLHHKLRYEDLEFITNKIKEVV